MSDQLTVRQFTDLLKSDREEALSQFLAAKVDEWLEDGPEEVVRVLTLWATNRGKDRPKLDLGSDAMIVELAQNCRLVEEPEDEAYKE